MVNIRFRAKCTFKNYFVEFFMTENLQEQLTELGYDKVAEYLKQYSSTTNAVPSFYIPIQKTIPDLYAALTSIHGLERFQLMYPTVSKIKELKIQADKIVRSFGEKKINYQQYIQLRESSPENLMNFLTSRLFIQLNGGSNSSLSYNDFFNYLFSVAYAVPHIKVLLSYDLSNSGIISIESFTKYVAQMVDRIYFVEMFTKKNHEFKQYYIQYVVNVIFARLDPLFTRVISIKDLIEDKIYLQFLNLDPTLEPDDEDESFKRNVFGPINPKSYIDVFSKLDMDHDGILKAEDVMQIPGIRWCRTFAESLISKASPAPNFEWYCRAQFCYDNIGEPWANAFYFDVMDINNDGVITEEDLAPIYAEVSQVLKQVVVNPQNPLPSFKWIVNENLDLYGVTNGEITKQLFINTKSTSGFIRHLVDIRGFIKWEADIDILMPKTS